MTPISVEARNAAGDTATRRPGKLIPGSGSMRMLSGSRRATSSGLGMSPGFASTMEVMSSS